MSFIPENEQIWANLVDGGVGWEHSQHDNVARFLCLFIIRPVVLVMRFGLILGHFQSMVDASIP